MSEQLVIKRLKVSRESRGDRREDPLNWVPCATFEDIKYIGLKKIYEQSRHKEQDDRIFIWLAKNKEYV